MKDLKQNFYEMCSFSETKHDKLLERGLTLFNSRQLSRVYPQASRLTSTNFNPVPMWSSGEILEFIFNLGQKSRILAVFVIFINPNIKSNNFQLSKNNFKIVFRFPFFV